MGGVEWVSSVRTIDEGIKVLLLIPVRSSKVVRGMYRWRGTLLPARSLLDFDEGTELGLLRASGPCLHHIWVSSKPIFLLLKVLSIWTKRSIKLPAGIFVPSLAAGAAVGRILGVSLQALVHRFPQWSFLPPESHIAPGVYALIGAAATLAGVTRTTVSLAVIVVELTGTLDYVVPVAIAILAAKVSSDAILPEGIYDLVINLNEFPYLDCKKDHHFGSRSIHDVVSHESTLASSTAKTLTMSL